MMCLSYLNFLKYLTEKKKNLKSKTNLIKKLPNMNITDIVNKHKVFVIKLFIECASHQNVLKFLKGK